MNGQSILNRFFSIRMNVFRDVVNGKIKYYAVKNLNKLEAVAKSIGIETEDRETNEIALDL